MNGTDVPLAPTVSAAYPQVNSLPTMADRTLVLFPGAVGDFLCALPALRSARQNGAPTTLVLRAELFPLLAPAEFDALSIDRREVADLFADGEVADTTRSLFGGHAMSHSWTGHGNEAFARRLRAATGGAVSMHRFRGMAPGEHASRYYARCLGVEPSPMRLEPPAAAERWARELWQTGDLPAAVLAVHAGSGSTRKSWQGMAAVAKEWRRRGGAVIAIAGPAESRVPEADLLVRGEPLDRIAALLRRARFYLGNDSGISHLAGLVGTPGMALFGPSDPAIWHPLGGSVRVVHAPTPCPGCGPELFCAHRLPVERVLAQLASLEASQPQWTRSVR
jgi:heptosyltransferase-3